MPVVDKSNHIVFLHTIPGVYVSIVIPSSFSIFSICVVSSVEQTVMARPCVPQRPVRPTRWTYVAASRAAPSWTTRFTLSKSTPRETRSVPTPMRAESVRNASMASFRRVWSIWRSSRPPRSCPAPRKTLFHPAERKYASRLSALE